MKISNINTSKNLRKLLINEGNENNIAYLEIRTWRLCIRPLRPGLMHSLQVRILW